MPGHAAARFAVHAEQGPRRPRARGGRAPGAGRACERSRRHEWPDALLLLGDQVYADQVSPKTERLFEERRGSGDACANVPPQGDVADVEEYSWLYREAWSDPATRWLLSTVPSAMIFDDHDVHDDWNTSWAWVLSHGLHHPEAWNEAVYDGAWGGTAARVGEKIRQAIALERWSAFHESFVRLTDLLHEAASGGRGPAPASVIVLSGDVHHAYLAEASHRLTGGLGSRSFCRARRVTLPWVRVWLAGVRR